jgi:hypothetical protein
VLNRHGEHDAENPESLMKELMGTVGNELLRDGTLPMMDKEDVEI